MRHGVVYSLSEPVWDSHVLTAVEMRSALGDRFHILLDGASSRAVSALRKSTGAPVFETSWKAATSAFGAGLGRDTDTALRQGSRFDLPRRQKDVSRLFTAPRFILWWRAVGQRLRYQYVWSVEKDAAFDGDLMRFWRAFSTDAADLLTSQLQTVGHSFWGWRLRTGALKNASVHVDTNITKLLVRGHSGYGRQNRSVNLLLRYTVVERFSARLLQRIDRHLVAGELMQSEIFASSVCGMEPWCQLGRWDAHGWRHPEKFHPRRELALPSFPSYCEMVVWEGRERQSTHTWLHPVIEMHGGLWGRSCLRTLNSSQPTRAMPTTSQRTGRRTWAEVCASEPCFVHPRYCAQGSPLPPARPACTAQRRRARCSAKQSLGVRWA